MSRQCNRMLLIVIVGLFLFLRQAKILYVIQKIPSTGDG